MTTKLLSLTRALISLAITIHIFVLKFRMALDGKTEAKALDAVNAASAVVAAAQLAMGRLQAAHHDAAFKSWSTSIAGTAEISSLRPGTVTA